jgi:hypothetical protein
MIGGRIEPVFLGAGGPQVPSRSLVAIDVSGMIPVETIPFHMNVPAGTVVWTDSPAFQVPVDGRITKITMYFPPGPGGDLRIRPMLLRGGVGAEGEQFDLLRYVGDLAYINGDDQQRMFNLKRPVQFQTNDRILMRYQNVDALNAHELIVDVELHFVADPFPRLGAVDPLGVR